ncbi:tripartite tricarboxylate transporter TctB family protein [Rhodobacteraceae bacterium D3-12]|nr:tripartite tricarboxylate transporter TctB family protein [Rhodobacteraceae bacterium D3-12]
MNMSTKKSSFLSTNWPAGLPLMVVGGLAIWFSREYPMGTLSAMGPGMLPVFLGGVLVLIGAFLSLQNAPKLNDDGEEKIALRSWGCVALGMLAFVAFGAWFGLLPATISLVALSAAGDRRNSLIDVLALSVGMSLIASLVFVYALGLPFPLLKFGGL